MARHVAAIGQLDMVLSVYRSNLLFAEQHGVGEIAEDIKAKVAEIEESRKVLVEDMQRTETKHETARAD